MATYYWIGGSGTLNDYTHWSTTSGGTALTAWPYAGVSPSSSNITNTLVGATGTLLQDINVDDNFLEITIPFTISFLGVTYSKLFVGSNSYITFGSGNTTLNVNASNPASPKICIGGGNNSSQRIYAETTGTIPNRIFRVRYEGTANNTGTPGSPTIVWEALFYENTPNQIDIQVGVHARLGGFWGMYSSTTLQATIPAAQNTGTRLITGPTYNYFSLIDDIVFDSASGSADYTITASTATFTVGNVTINGPSTGTLTIGLDRLEVYGTTFTIAATGVATSNGTTFSTMTFKGNSSTQTLNTNNINIRNSIEIDSISRGPVVLGTALTVQIPTIAFSQYLKITSGTFSTNNYNLTCCNLYSSNTNTRTINLGSSTITIGFLVSASDCVLDFTNSTGLTLNAGTSTITNPSAYANKWLFYTGGKTFYNLTFNCNYGNVALQTTGNFTCNNFTVVQGNFTDSTVDISSDTGFTVNGTMTLLPPNSVWPANRMILRSATQGTPITITANTRSFRDVDFQDINAAGTGLPWTGTRLGNCTNCTNITFDTPRTVYWSGSGTNMNYWGSGSTYGWATSSGGTPAIINFPLPQDTAIFNDTNLTAGSSFNTSFATRWGTLDFSARTLSLTINQYFSRSTNIYSGFIYGDLKLSSGSAITYTVNATSNIHNSLWFAGNSTSNIYPNNSSRGIQFGVFKPPGTSVVLQGNFTNTFYTNLLSGTLNLNNYILKTGQFASNGSTSPYSTRILDFGTSGIITLEAQGGTIWDTNTPTGLTISGTGTIIINSGSTFQGGNITLPVTLQINVSSFTFGGYNTIFNNITSSTTTTKTIIFPTANTITFNNWNLNGTSGNLVTLQSSTAGTKGNLKNSSGIPFNMSYVSVKDLSGSPTNQWKALIKNGCVNAGNNRGWVFVPTSGMMAFFT